MTSVNSPPTHVQCLITKLLRRCEGCAYLNNELRKAWLGMGQNTLVIPGASQWQAATVKPSKVTALSSDKRSSSCASNWTSHQRLYHVCLCVWWDHRELDAGRTRTPCFYITVLPCSNKLASSESRGFWRGRRQETEQGLWSSWGSWEP